MEFFISRSKVLKGLLPSLAFILVGGFVIAADRGIFGYIVGASGLIFGLTLLIVIIGKLLRSEAQVVISEKGIDDRRLRTEIIPWDEIIAITLNETKYARWLTVELASPEKYYSKLPVAQIFLRKLNGQEGANDLRIRFNDLDGSIDDAFEYIAKLKELLNPDMALKP